MWEELTKELDKLSPKEMSAQYHFLGEGIARRVYALDDEYVIKISKGIDGFYQNSVENYVFQNASSNLKTILCPIEYFTPKHIVMRRATPMSFFTKTKYINISNFTGYSHIKNYLDTLTDKFYLLEEDLYSPTSWGFLDDSLRLIDYGCTSNYGDYYYDFVFTLDKLDNFW
ncbi:hypothetical protein [Clostridium intestinale]|uniref:hypothetical protein n=1 Tax=Clostridium intestinale TaxID=36845 RepID=UPI0028EF0E6C|nr:hypothetical protein [Clostridium intestinale]